MVRTIRNLTSPDFIFRSYGELRGYDRHCAISCFMVCYADMIHNAPSFKGHMPSAELPCMTAAVNPAPAARGRPCGRGSGRRKPQLAVAERNVRLIASRIGRGRAPGAPVDRLDCNLSWSWIRRQSRGRRT
jgi:hypothetical protein